MLFYVVLPQPSEDPCMAFCPTGFTANGEPGRRCAIDGDIRDVISSNKFDDNDTQWSFIGLNGRFEGPLLPGRYPVLQPNRGLYFAEFDDFMNRTCVFLRRFSRSRHMK